MRETIQTDHHPDADQISAFVEHVLPAHEQQEMLAHLSVCQECRATVAHSLPPEAPASPAIKRSWFSGWGLALPAGIAVAALAWFAVYLHNTSNVRPPTETPAQVAVSHPPPPLIEESPATPAQNESIAQKEKPKEREESRQLAPRFAFAPPTTMGARMQAVPQTTVDQKNADKADAKAEEFKDSGSVKTTSENALVSNAPLAGGAAGAMQAYSATASPPAIASAGAIGGPALKKVEIPAQISLPSGLPVVSVAANLRQILAIDIRNDVFLSEDAGVNWKAVSIRWKGRAVKADLVSYSPVRRLDQPLARDAQAAALAGARTKPLLSEATGAPLPPAQLTGTITDQSGAVIPGASISVNSREGQQVHTAVTDRDGRYSVSQLPPGTYNIKTQALGFQQQLTQDVHVTADKPAVANVTLSVGSASQTVEVESTDNLTQLQEFDRKALAKSLPAPPAADIFEITTDLGERWTSPDGLTWKRK